MRFIAAVLSGIIIGLYLPFLKPHFIEEPFASFFTVYGVLLSYFLIELLLKYFIIRIIPLRPFAKDAYVELVNLKYPSPLTVAREIGGEREISSLEDYFKMVAYSQNSDFSEDLRMSAAYHFALLNHARLNNRHLNYLHTKKSLRRSFVRYAEDHLEYDKLNAAILFASINDSYEYRIREELGCGVILLLVAAITAITWLLPTILWWHSLLFLLVLLVGWMNLERAKVKYFEWKYGVSSGTDWSD